MRTIGLFTGAINNTIQRYNATRGVRSGIFTGENISQHNSVRNGAIDVFPSSHLGGNFHREKRIFFSQFRAAVPSGVWQGPITLSLQSLIGGNLCGQGEMSTLVAWGVGSLIHVLSVRSGLSLGTLRILWITFSPFWFIYLWATVIMADRWVAWIQYISHVLIRKTSL